MKHTLVCLILFFCPILCSAQQIVLLEEGRAIKLTIDHVPNAKVGETLSFHVKYDVYTEDNLVIESESVVKGKVINMGSNGELFVKIDQIKDLHGKNIKVRTYKQHAQPLKVERMQSEYIIYVDEGFWFSY